MSKKPNEYAGDDAFDALPQRGMEDDEVAFVLPDDVEIDMEAIADIAVDLDEDEYEYGPGGPLLGLDEAIADLEEHPGGLGDATPDVLKKEKMGKAARTSKHALEYDSIFRGKKRDPLDPDEQDVIYDVRSDKMEIDPGSSIHLEASDPEEYARAKLLKQRVYEVITELTKIDIKANRRKPSKVDFNSYFDLMKVELREEGFSRSEIFVELAHYFSDNLFNMFKLLSKEAGGEIMAELAERYNLKPLENIDFLW